jgi:flagellar hook-associated protein 2
MAITGSLPTSSSGLDVEDLIGRLVAIRNQSVTALQTRQQQINQASSTVSAFSTRLSTLSRAARSLDSTSEFNATTATSSDATYVAASSSGGIVPGSYTVAVSRLASEQRTRSNTFASSTDPIGLSGTLDFTIGAGSPVSVTVNTTDTLNDVAARISASGARINASVIYDGSNYRMLVRGLDSGDANTITFSESTPALTASLGLSTPANTYQAAQDALFTVDGISMQRTTNQVTNAIPGVTLALARTTASDVRITVATDPAAIKAKVQAFVAAYNDVVTASHTATGFGSTRASNPVLAGDWSFRSSLQRLSRLAGSSVPGTSGSYTTLASVGVRLQNDGSLQINDTAFSAAVAADPLAVSKVFVTDVGIGATGLMDSFATTITELSSNTNSTMLVRGATLSAQSQTLSVRIRREQDSVTAYRETLRSQFTAMETIVSRYKAIL